MHTAMKAVLSLSSLFALPGITGAALIAWQPSVQMFPGTTTDTFVDSSFGLQQTLAFNPNDGLTNDITLNGVTFTDVQGPDTSSLLGTAGETVTLGVGSITANTGAFGDGSFSGNGDIFDVLRSATWNVQSVTLDNLFPGREYQVQIFTNDARGNRNSNFQAGFSDGVNNFATSLSGGTAGIANLSNRDPISGAGEASGDYIIGTFTADASGTQSFFVQGTDQGYPDGRNSGGRAQINAFSLRSTVPEPSRAVLLALGGLTLLVRRRR